MFNKVVSSPLGAVLVVLRVDSRVVSSLALHQDQEVKWVDVEDRATCLLRMVALLMVCNRWVDLVFVAEWHPINKMLQWAVPGSKVAKALWVLVMLVLEVLPKVNLAVVSQWVDLKV
jgi:hypothetical protein